MPFILKKLFSVLIITVLLFGCTTTKKSNPKAAHINVKLSAFYLEQGEVRKAKKKLFLAHSQSVDDPVVHKGLGDFFVHVGELNFADKHYLRALNLSNFRGKFCDSYARFLYQQKKYPKALKYFLKAAADKGYMHKAQAYSDAARCAEKMNLLDLANKYRSMILLGSS